MAYSIIQRITNKYQTGDEITAVLDTADDLALLGTEYPPGSIAMVADKGVKSFMLNASHEWKEI